MSFVMPEIIVQKVIQEGIEELRQDPIAFNNVFESFAQDPLIKDYGQTYIDQVRKWFMETKIPVVQSWSFNTQRIPCISIHLSTELEDESKAAAGDYYGMGQEENLGVAVFTVMVDIGIHATRASDQVLWLYYITAYILFKQKLYASSLGLQIHTYSASDYSKDMAKMPDNIFSRWLRFRCTTENLFSQGPLGPQAKDIELDLDAGRVGETDDIVIIEEDFNVEE